MDSGADNIFSDGASGIELRKVSYNKNMTLSDRLQEAQYNLEKGFK